MKRNRNRNENRVVKDAKGLERAATEAINAESKGKSGRNSRRGGRSDYNPERPSSVSKSNPIELYDYYNQLYQDATRTPMATMVGRDIPVTTFSTYGSEFNIDQLQNTTVAGVMVINYVPTVGVSNNKTDPISKASSTFYAWIRSRLRLSEKYDPSDVSLYEVAYASAASLHTFLIRAYGIANQTTPFNVYYPNVLLAMMGLSYISTRQDLMRLRTMINKLGADLSTYRVPKNLRLMGRWSWLNSGLYVDSTGVRAQTYMFVPRGFLKYDNTFESGTRLVYKEWIPNPMAYKTLDMVQAYIDDLMDALAGDADAAAMTADIINAYGYENTYEPPVIPENYTVVPSYDPVVLSQISNMRIAGMPIVESLNVTQDPAINSGAIVSNPAVTPNIITIKPNTGTAMEMSEQILLRNVLNLHVDTPTPELVMESTRLMYVVDSVKSSFDRVVIKSCGTELITDFVIAATKVKNNASIIRSQWNSQTLTTGTALSIYNAVKLSEFDWHPLLYAFGSNPDSTKPGTIFYGFLGDVDNIASISDEQLQALHEAALLSEFEIPRPAK